MSFRHTGFWSVLAAVFAGLTLLILLAAAVAPQPEPLRLKAAAPPAPADLRISTAVELSPPDQESATVKSAVDASYRIGKYLKIAGWAYIDKQPTEGQDVYVQLEKPGGSAECYSTVPMERPDIAAAFKNPLYNDSGFSALIPSRESLDSNFYTIRVVVKNQRGELYKSKTCKQDTWSSAPATLPAAAAESRPVAFGLEAGRVRKKGFAEYQYLSGWAYAGAQPTRDQEIFVQLKKPDGKVVNYSTMPLKRLESADAAANRQHGDCGFFALIPLKDGFDIHFYTIRLVVKNKTGTHKSAIWQPGYRVSTRAAVKPPKLESPSVAFGVAASEYRGKSADGYRYLNGWAYVAGEPTMGQEVYVELEKPDGTAALYSTMQLERTDIAAAAGSQLYNTSGFCALIPLLDGIDCNACAIRFVVKTRNGTYKSKLWRPALTGLNPAAALTPPETETRLIKFNIDTNEKRGNGLAAHLYVDGWAYVAVQPTMDQEVFVQVEKADGTVACYTTTPVERPDVAGAAKNPLYSLAGFFTLIPLADGFDSGAYTIRVVLKTRHGIYKSNPWNSEKALMPRPDKPHRIKR